MPLIQSSTWLDILLNVDRATGCRAASPRKVKHIGKAIKQVFDSKPRSCTASWLARQIHCHRANVYDIFSRSTIDCELLERISIALDHNFFADLSADLDNRSDTRPSDVGDHPVS